MVARMEKATRPWRKGKEQNHGYQGEGIIWVLFHTQDTIEGVSDLGSTTVLLRGDNYNCFTHLMPQI